MKLPSLRCSIGGMMGAVVLIAVGGVALRSGSELWASGAFSAAVGLVIVAAIGVAFCSTRLRAFWGGILIVTSAYLMIAFGPWFEYRIKNELITTKLLRMVFDEESIFPKIKPNVIISDGPFVLYADLATGESTQYLLANVSDKQNPLIPVKPSWENFQRVGHSLLAIMTGMIGGLLAARWRTAKSEPFGSETKTADDPNSSAAHESSVSPDRPNSKSPTPAAAASSNWKC